MQHFETTSLLNQIVKNWEQQYSDTTLINEKQIVHEIVGKLDYSKSYSLQSIDNKNMYFIKIKLEGHIGVEKYLSFIQNDGSYIFDGIYYGKDITSIRSFFNSKDLSENETILVYKVNGKPLKGWTKSGDGKLISMKAEEKSQIIPNLKQINSLTMLSNIKRVNNMAAPVQPCVYIYWVTYIEETGEILSIVLEDTICPSDQTISSSNVIPQQECNDAYNEELQSFNATVNSSAEQNYTATINTDALSGNGITKNWNDDWICFTDANPNGFTLRSFESGKLRKAKNSIDPKHSWVWQSMKHETITIDGSPMPGTNVTFTQGLGYPNFTEENAAIYDYYVAIMEVKFSVTFSFKPVGNCPIVSDILQILPHSTKNYTAHAAWNL